MSVRLAPQLEACTTPNDEVAVTGALRNVLTAGLPALLVDEGYEVLLVQEGFRSVAALRTLKERHLLDMGLDRGTASLVWECILPPAASAVVLGVAAPDAAENTTRAARLGPMRPFPAVDSGGLPDLNGLRVYGTALQAHVWPAITEETKLAFAPQEQQEARYTPTEPTLFPCPDPCPAGAAPSASSALSRCETLPVRAEPRTPHQPTGRATLR